MRAACCTQAVQRGTSAPSANAYRARNNAHLQLVGRGRGSQAARGDGAGRGAGGEAGPAAEIAAASFLSVSGAPLRNEYDPARPNDYAAIRRQREEARKEAEREAERQEAMRRAEAAAAALAAARPDEARDVPTPDAERDAAGAGHSQPPVPVASASGEEAYLRRARFLSRAQKKVRDFLMNIVRWQ